MVNHSIFLLAHLGHLNSFSSEGPLGAAIWNLPPHCRHTYSQGGGPLTRLQAINSWTSPLEHRGHFTSPAWCGSSKSNSSRHRLHRYFVACIYPIPLILYTEPIPKGKSRTWQEAPSLFSKRPTITRCPIWARRNRYARRQIVPIQPPSTAINLANTMLRC